ncbi:MAG: ATP synthase subunit I [Desulfobacterales bacterium]|nr:ATP synthase subunit I [Desulfobacterales bacterium]
MILTTGPIKTLEAIRETEKKYCSLALTIAVVIAIVCFILAFKPLGKGLILGAVFSIANFIIMGETLPMRIGHNRRRSTGISFVSIFGRYALMAIPLALSIKLSQFNLAATVCGLFMIQLVILTEHIVNLIQMKFRKTQLL